MIKDKIQQTIQKTRACSHCGEVFENISPLALGRHVQHCDKRISVTVELSDHTVTVCNISYYDPKTPLKAIRFKCLDCSVGSTKEVDQCPVIESRRFGIQRETAHRNGKNVTESEFE